MPSQSNLRARPSPLPPFAIEIDTSPFGSNSVASFYVLPTPTFPVNLPAATGAPSTALSGKAGSGRDAGPKTTLAPLLGSNSELWQGQWMIRRSVRQPVTGHSACVHEAE